MSSLSSLRHGEFDNYEVRKILSFETKFLSSAGYLRVNKMRHTFIRKEEGVQSIKKTI